MRFQTTAIAVAAYAKGLKHLPGQHDQRDHGRGRSGGAPSSQKPGKAPAQEKPQAVTDEAMREAFDGWQKGLSGIERQTVRDYTAGAFYGVSSSLRFGGKLNATEEAQCAALDSALSKGAAPVAMELHRGLIATPGLWETFSKLEGKEFVDKGYVSTCIDKAKTDEIFGVNADRGTFLMHISVPKGHKGAYVAALSEEPESEFLLPRNSRFHVKKVYTDSSGKRHVDVQALG